MLVTIGDFQSTIGQMHAAVEELPTGAPAWDKIRREIFEALSEAETDWAIGDKESAKIFRSKARGLLKAAEIFAEAGA